MSDKQTREQMLQRPDRQSKCQHDYRRTGTTGMCIVYECRKCGDSYEKDVS